MISHIPGRSRLYSRYIRVPAVDFQVFRRYLASVLTGLSVFNGARAPGDVIRIRKYNGHGTGGKEKII